MVIPLIGPILFSDIDRELNRDVVITETSLGAAGTELISRTVNQLTDASLLRGRGNFVGLQTTFVGLNNGISNSLFEYTVPDYRSMIVSLIAPGGGGGAGSTTLTGPTAANGTDGGNAEFRTATPVVGFGGLGGKGGGIGGNPNFVQPASSGTGGDVYYSTFIGSTTLESGKGEPGTVDISGSGSVGGLGGRATKIFTRGTPGAPVPGTTVPVFIGAVGKSGNPNLRGGPGQGELSFYNGGLGFVVIKWTARLLIPPFIYEYPGIWTFTVPNYTNQLQVFVYGATGGGGAARSINGSTSPTNGTAGGDTIFGSATPIFAGGGGGGGGSGFGVNGQTGTLGVSSGPPTSTEIGSTKSPGRGANGLNGIGGDGGANAGRMWMFVLGRPGSPVPGTTIEVRVGAGGQNGDPNLTGIFDGENGRVDIIWG